MKRCLAAVALVVVVAAGCSSDDTASDQTTTSTTAGSTTTTEPKPVSSAGCGQATEAEAKAKHTMQVDGQERYYLASVPSRTAGDDPMPLVVDIHGLAEGAEIQAAMSNFGALAEREGFAVVEPNGTGSPIHWASNPDTNPNPDLDFITAMLDQVGKDLCIDESRVYATGLSNGAMMTSLLGCVMSDRFAAIAPVAGVQFYDSCDPKRPVPVLAFHGTKDPILLFNGGVDVGPIEGVLGGNKGPTSSTTTTTEPPTDLNGSGYPAAVQSWADHNGCKSSKDEDVGKDLIHRVYDCPEDGSVEFYIVKGGGHAWPGSDFSKQIESVVGYTTFDVDATDVIWKFLQQHRLPPGSPPS